MATEVRPGDYRVCPECGTRHKVQDLRCTKCNAVLAGAPVHQASSAAVIRTGARSSRTIRIVLAVGLLIAVGAGLWVRSLFRGARLDDSVQAASAAAPAAVPEPQPAPSWSPPVLQYPPMVGYNRGGPASTAGLAPGSPAPDAAAPTGMTSIAPPSEPTRQTTFTNEDLQHARTASTSGPVATAPAAPAAPVTPVAALGARALAGDETREWLSRVRDREEDVQKAQAKVRRMETEVDVLRAQAAAATADPEVRARAQKDLADALDELEKAEGKLAGKQRDLDEEKDKARAAGLRFER